MNFVTHSMGGIVVRTYLNKYQPDHLGRVVMIAPPNQGAYLADLLGNWLPYKLIWGPPGSSCAKVRSAAVLARAYPVASLESSPAAWPCTRHEPAGSWR